MPYPSEKEMTKVIKFLAWCCPPLWPVMVWLKYDKWKESKKSNNPEE